jgi:hypothetical protein
VAFDLAVFVCWLTIDDPNGPEIDNRPQPMFGWVCRLARITFTVALFAHAFAFVCVCVSCALVLYVFNDYWWFCSTRLFHSLFN